MNRNGIIYYYVTNIQGDVEQILESDGDVVVSYVYDAYGRVVNISGDFASTIGEENPFRYRSYYFDSESGYYYLQSRYYDSSMGRFINADEIDNAIEESDDDLSNNLFAYYTNNPVNNIDDDGNWKLSNKAKFGIGMLALAGALALTLATGGAATPVLVGVVGSTLSGAAIGGGIGYASGGMAGLKTGLRDGAVDGFMWGGIGAAAAVASKAYLAYKASKPASAVIGKLKDLKNIRKNEYTLLNKLPDKGSPKLNWKQNSSVLREEMRRRIPIRDASKYPLNNTGFLRAERNILKNRGWTYSKGYWRIGR